MTTRTRDPGHLGPFLKSLRERAGYSLRYLGMLSCLGHNTIAQAENSRERMMSLDKALTCARTCNASTDELARVRVLDALDRGALPLPDGATEEHVRAAMDLLEARIAWRKAPKKRGAR